MQPLGVGAARKGFAGSPFCGDTAICAWPCEIKNTVCPWNIYIYILYNSNIDNNNNSNNSNIIYIYIYITFGYLWGKTQESQTTLRPQTSHDRFFVRLDSSTLSLRSPCSRSPCSRSLSRSRPPRPWTRPWLHLRRWPAPLARRARPARRVERRRGTDGFDAGTPFPPCGGSERVPFCEGGNK